MRAGEMLLSLPSHNPQDEWTPEALEQLLRGLPEAVPGSNPEWLRDEEADIPQPPARSPLEAGMRAQAVLALHKMLPEVALVKIDPALNWSRARGLLQGVRAELGKTYRLMLALHAVAFAKRRRGTRLPPSCCRGGSWGRSSA